MTNAPHRLAVFPCRIRHQSVELPSGHLIAVEAETPAHAFAIVHEHAGQVEILGIRENEAAAIEHCKALQEELERLAETVEAEGRRRMH